MASSSGAIRAGRAFIEIFTDDTKLQRGLNAAGKKISAFGNGITSLGKRFALLGAAAAAPLGLAVKKFADAGSGLVDMSDRIGIAVEQLSTLRYAAEQSGATLEDLEVGVKFMQKALAAAAGGNKTAIASFTALGLSVDELAKLTPDEQFRRIATAISGLGDDTAITAMSMKLLGKSGTTLIPLMMGGAKGIEELQQSARDAGLEMSQEMAVAAERLGDEMQTLNNQISRLVINVGGALAPVASKLLGYITPLIEAFGKWAAANPELITIVAAVAAGVTALGVSLAVIGPIVASIGAGFGALATAMGIVLNPITLVVGAIAGIGIAIAHMTGDLDAAIETVKGIFGEMKSDAALAFSGIAEAIKAGNIEGALAILATTLKLEWMRVLNELEQMWGAFADKATVIAYKSNPLNSAEDTAALEADLAAQRQSQAFARNRDIDKLKLQLGQQVSGAGGTQGAPLGPDGKPLPAFDQFGAPNPGFDMQGNYTGKRAQRVENTDDSSGMAAGIPASGMNALAASFTSAVSDSISSAGEFLTSDRVGKGRNASLGLSGLLSGGLSTASDFMNQIGGGVAVAEQAVAKSSSAGSFNGMFAGQQLSGQQTEKQIAENTKQSAKYLKDMARRDKLGFV